MQFSRQQGVPCVDELPHSTMKLSGLAIDGCDSIADRRGPKRAISPLLEPLKLA